MCAARAIVFLLGLALTVGSASAGDLLEALSPAVVEQIEAVLRDKAHRSAAERKIDSSLLGGARGVAAGASSSAGVAQTIEASAVYVELWDSPAAHHDALVAAGLVIGAVNEAHRLVQGMIAPGALARLAGLPVVRSVSPVIPPHADTGAATTQGDAAAKADLVRQLGFDGSGVTVGVISTGIDGWLVSLLNGELPNIVVPPGCSAGSGDEGTAMLEIVHDLAPSANLLFSGASSVVDMLNAFDCLARAGAQVIVDDLTFYDAPNFEEGPIARAARATVDAGVSLHSSAGNTQGQYLLQEFRPGPAVPGLSVVVHDFGSGKWFNEIRVTGTDSFSCHLQWNDPFDQSSNDYDLLLLDMMTGERLATSSNVQDGRGRPYEWLPFDNAGAADRTVGVVILKKDPALPRTLKLLCPLDGAPGARPLQGYSEAGGTFGHQAVPGVVAVAAIDVQSLMLDRMYSFSTHGPAEIFFPAPETRSKPDLAGFTGVMTSRPGYTTFWGTSAAAPHSAAVAALLLSKNPFLTPAEVMAALKGGAVDIEPAGVDLVSGAGRLDALGAIMAVASPECRTDAGCSRDVCSIGSCDRGVCRDRERTCDDGHLCTHDSCDAVVGCVFKVPDGARGAGCLLTTALANDDCHVLIRQHRGGLELKGWLRDLASFVDRAVKHPSPKRLGRARTRLTKAKKLIRRLAGQARMADCADLLVPALEDAGGRLRQLAILPSSILPR